MNFLKITLLVFLAFSAQHSFSQEVPSNHKPRIGLEIDPATFAFGGYGIHLRYQPKSSEHLLLGFGTYAMEMPKALVDLNPSNKDQSWNLRLQQGYGLFVEYHFSQTNKGAFTGLQTSLQKYRIENDELEGSETFSNILGMAFAGYSWQPFDFNLYVKPWAGIGYTSQIAGSNQLGSKEYDIAPLTYFATLHLGYTF